MALFKRELKSSDLQAMNQAYRGDVDGASVGKVFTPLVIVFFTVIFAYILYVSIPWTIFWGLVALWYSYVSAVPKEIANYYYRQGSIQRCKAMRIMSQALSNPNNQAIDVVNIAIQRTKGEFKEDLKIIAANLTSRQSKDRIFAAFQRLSNKYAEDELFVDFMDKIQFFHNEGYADIKSCKRLTNSYNKVYSIQQKNIAKKSDSKKSTSFYLLIAFVVIFIISNSMEFKNWTDVQAHSFGGIITSTICMTIVYITMNAKYFKNYYHDSVTTTDKGHI